MKKTLLVALIFTLFASCKKDNGNNNNQGFATDIDGNQYPIVTIQSQTWMAKNLNVSRYSDGTVIPLVTDPSQWASSTTGECCYLENKTANGTVYGKLYNWYAVAGIYDAASLANPSLRKKLAPQGWHIPSDVEWTILTDYLGGQDVAGGKMKSTGTEYWLSPNTDATNSSGFSGLPGARLSFTGNFGYIGEGTFWWTSTEFDTNNAWYRGLSYGNGSVDVDYLYKLNGYSVRCVKD